MTKRLTRDVAFNALASVMDAHAELSTLLNGPHYKRHSAAHLALVMSTIKCREVIDALTAVTKALSPKAPR